MENKKKIIIAVGCRPNFMKIALLYPMLKKDYDVFTIHTGQHYDNKMSKSFVNEFNIEVDRYLGCQSTDRIERFCLIMDQFSRFMFAPVDLVIVVGDVDSTLACAIAAKYAGIPVAHIEAGMRSGDLNQPEEINRCAVDAIGDYNFCIKESHSHALSPNTKRWVVGNTMIDLLKKYTDHLKPANGFEYCLTTIHRRENLTKENLTKVVQILNNVSKKIDIIFPVHPHTQKKLLKYGLKLDFQAQKPMGYKEFVQCMRQAKFVITDSGGVQAEANYLSKKIYVLRERTEHDSANLQLVGLDEKEALSKIDKVSWVDVCIYEGQDGNASERIYKIIKEEIL